MILTLLTYQVNRSGDFMSFEQIVTYIIAPLATAIAAIWGLVKWVIPKFVDAKLTEQKDVREHRQKIDELGQAYYHSEREVTNQAMASVVAAAQEEEKKSNDFIRTVIFNNITDTNRRIANLETKLSLFINWRTGGKFEDTEKPTGDFEAWKKNKIDDNHQPPIKPSQARSSDE